MFQSDSLFLAFYFSVPAKKGFECACEVVCINMITFVFVQAFIFVSAQRSGWSMHESWDTNSIPFST